MTKTKESLKCRHMQKYHQ